jgi:hypothetical protein
MGVAVQACRSESLRRVDAHINPCHIKLTYVISNPRRSHKRKDKRDARMSVVGEVAGRGQQRRREAMNAQRLLTLRV